MSIKHRPPSNRCRCWRLRRAWSRTIQKREPRTAEIFVQRMTNRSPPENNLCLRLMFPRLDSFSGNAKRVAISNASREPGIGRANLVIFRKRMPGLSRSTVERFVLRARRLAKLRGTVNILIAGNSELRALNRRFRGVDKSTDVLSFPAAG